MLIEKATVPFHITAIERQNSLSVHWLHFSLDSPASFPFTRLNARVAVTRLLCL